MFYLSNSLFSNFVGYIDGFSLQTTTTNGRRKIYMTCSVCEYIILITPCMCDWSFRLFKYVTNRPSWLDSNIAHARNISPTTCVCEIIPLTLHCHNIIWEWVNCRCYLALCVYAIFEFFSARNFEGLRRNSEPWGCISGGFKSGPGSHGPPNF